MKTYYRIYDLVEPERLQSRDRGAPDRIVLSTPESFSLCDRFDSREEAMAEIEKANKERDFRIFCNEMVILEVTDMNFS